MRFHLLAALAAAMLAPVLAVAAPRSFRLEPPSATMVIRAYGMGVVPTDANVGRFDGVLTYDPARPGQCSATLTAQVGSVQTSASMRETILGPDFLDVARFPTLAFTGTCTGPETMAGNLTMRGVTRPLSMRLEWEPHNLVATGSLQRAQWGMVAKPVVVGREIRIRVATTLP